MDTNRLISSLCYFSIFFAGFLFPIAIYFIVDSYEVKEHAKKALISHVIPFLSVIGFIFLFLLSGGHPSIIGGFSILLAIGLINIAVVVWNIVKGIKVLIY
ncbi:DUF4870 domain-containing protein [Calidifontibacillus erzurumensis]|uniref:DUF4870 domain-containing protein n=1 Tax=Calidifontibacillus erzurumensis TaxID=2741433 RepID=A0A8J8KBP7_9BACI|nr:DUF4870 domain-containing protein [Calidifontibacillus erzurumensis]NSL51832.1 DUF4870 domain-containing protein [Calidifontibacillus erzurumensis]